jgi:hypothetical protein
LIYYYLRNGIDNILKGGIMYERYWAFLRLGVAGQLRTSWQIDGNDATPGSERMPAITTKLI